MIPRWCPSGQHFQPPDRFRISGGKMVAYCMGCEASARKARARRIAARADGVDIDRIHRTLAAKGRA